MSNPAALWYFESVNLYHILCPHKVKTMAERHQFIHFKRDQFIYLPEDPASTLYMISDGRVKIGHYLDDGKEVIKSILTTGELFGELALAGEEKRSDFAQAMDDKTTVCPLSTEELKNLMFDNRELSFKILKLV